LYTPVTPQLQNIAERLGNYLHASNKSHPPQDAWWADFKTLLNLGGDLLGEATVGTLLGPPLVSRKTGKGKVIIELLDGQDPGTSIASFGAPGRRVRVDVAVFNSLADARGDAA